MTPTIGSTPPARPTPSRSATLRRVLVIGSGGAGKTTLARALAEATGLPLIHLDRHYWRSGWTPTPPEEWAQAVDALTSRPEWIMDGNYGGTLETRLAAADTVVFMDTPRLTCLARVVRRRLANRGRSRPSLPPGCPERLDPGFLHWIWTYPTRRREGILEHLAAVRPGTRVHVLKGPGDVERFLDGVPRTN